MHEMQLDHDPDIAQINTRINRPFGTRVNRPYWQPMIQLHAMLYMMHTLEIITIFTTSTRIFKLSFKIFITFIKSFSLKNKRLKHNVMLCHKR